VPTNRTHPRLSSSTESPRTSLAGGRVQLVRRRARISAPCWNVLSIPKSAARWAPFHPARLRRPPGQADIEEPLRADWTWCRPCASDRYRAERAETTKTRTRSDRKRSLSSGNSTPNSARLAFSIRRALGNFLYVTLDLFKRLEGRSSLLDSLREARCFTWNPCGHARSVPRYRDQTVAKEIAELVL